MRYRVYLSFSLLCCLVQLSVLANVSLPSIWGNHMVLQQNKEVELWGWGNPTEAIKVSASWDTDTLKTVVGNHATWAVKLNAPPAGGPYEITIQGYNTVSIKDILVGEVWLCSGQSNMEFSASWGMEHKDEEVQKANHEDIRFFSVTKRTANTPLSDVVGKWVVCSPKTMAHFSAVGYFFGEKLNRTLNLPVGLICSSWGGSPIEPWIPESRIFANEELVNSAHLLEQKKWAPIEPGVIYNAMIKPIMPFAIAGMLWYQGEENVSNPNTYTENLSVLADSWRKGFQVKFPFYYAQIAPFRGYSGDSGVRVREAQRRALSIESSGMIVLSDIGDTMDIHPRNKIDVGYRFADLVLNQTYGFENLPKSGPLYSGFMVEGKKIIVSFDYNEGLHARGKVLQYFELAGEDGVWFPANAYIKNNEVLVSSKQVKKPVNVRFAWTNAAVPNLYNEWGLPASCFTTVWP